MTVTRPRPISGCLCGLAMLVCAVMRIQAGDEPANDSGAESPSSPSKKLIEWGWDEPDTRFMREHITEMERLPFDGLVFHVHSAKGDNFLWEMWGGRRFEYDEFAPAVADLQATDFRRFTEHFLRVNVTPGNVDW